MMVDQGANNKNRSDRRWRSWRDGGRSFWMAVGFALAVIVGGSYAFGAIGGGGVINACYDKSGNLRVIDPSSSSCKNNETALDWNQTGPAGPPGPPGPPGSNGFASLTYVKATVTYHPSNPAGTQYYGEATCPNGLHVVGGSAASTTAALADFPSDGSAAGNDGTTAWFGRGTGSASVGAFVYAICAPADVVTGP
jgi:hypothetical protein